MPGNILSRKSSDPRDLRKLYCKIIMQIREFKGMNPFSEADVIDLIIHKAKWVTNIEYYPGRRKIKTEQINFSKTDAINAWRNIVKNGYVIPAGRRMPDRLHPRVPQGGVQLWKIDQYTMSECEEQSWYKSSMRKREWKERHEQLDVQRCHVLRQLYSLFGTSWFTYDMATSITKYMGQLSATKSAGITERDKKIMRAVMQRFEINSNEFKRVWNSLIRNNYIIAWRRKTPQGYVQTNAYVVNRNLLKRCLSAYEI